jgi:tetratricopeptide (TPR) repeat protein
MNDMSAVIQRGFDPLLANLFYLYGTALLYHYITTTGMFGDAAQKNVDDVAKTFDENTEGDAVLAELLLQELAAAGGEGKDHGEDGDAALARVLATGGDEAVAKSIQVEEEETIDADQEAERQARNASRKTDSTESSMKSTEKKQKEPEEEEEQSAPKEQVTKQGEVDGQEGEEGEEGEEDEEDEEGEEQEGEGQEAAEEEPKENDLELAWQVLEIARVLYASQGESKNLELSDVHFSLGTLAWEDEKPEEARAEFDKALKLAQDAKERRAQAQVLLMISTTQEGKGETEQAVETLEQAKKLLTDEITKIRATQPRAPAIDILQGTIKEIEDRVFSLKEKWTPAHPDDLKDLPDPNAPIKFSFKPPTGFKAPAGFAKPSAAASAPTASVNTILPKKKTPAPAAAPAATVSSTAMDTSQSSSSELQTESTKVDPASTTAAEANRNHNESTSASQANGTASSSNAVVEDLPEPVNRQKRPAEDIPTEETPEAKKLSHGAAE